MTPTASDPSSAGDLVPEPPRRPALGRIEIVVNPASGGVGPKASEECRALLERLGVEAHVIEAQPNRVRAAVEAAVEALPDVVVVLAGDGTAAAAAALAGPKGPLIAPLPGGTMNLLPRALYGPVDWRAALELALTEGVARPVAGGSVGDRPFHVAAILGAPALWAPAREAVRAGKVRLAWLYARRAARKAFSGKVRFRLDDGTAGRGEALALLSPLISKAMSEPIGLEAAILTPRNAADAFRLAANALFADWRADPAVAVQVCRTAEVMSRGRIPAILDGEPLELDPRVRIRFLPTAFRALAPARAIDQAG